MAPVATFRRAVQAILGLAAALVLAACQLAAPAGAPVKVGLVAPFTGRSGPSGEAIQRGIQLALDEVNRAGGVLGRPLALVTRDVQNDPVGGVAALRELIDQEAIVAVFGGIYSPVMLGQLPLIHERHVPLINAWGSITGITRNGYAPNYAFRVGLNDEQADEFIVRYALDVAGLKRPGVLVDTTAWGDSNRAGLTDWLARRQVTPVAVERFDQGETVLLRQVGRLQVAGADGVIMAADTSEGAAAVRAMSSLGWRVPVVSHWGVSGGQFVELAGADNAEGVLTLQTYSFLRPATPRADPVLKAYHSRYGTRRIEEVLAPLGVAQGYDGMHLLALAIQRAGSTDGERIRDALEHLPAYEGLIKRYAPAFTPESHDPLTAEDLMMAVWHGARLVPADPARLPS